MELALIILKQTLTMAIYMAVGYVLFRGKKITVEGSRNMANLLLWVILPAVILNSFCVEPTPEKLRQFLVSFGFTALSMGCAILVARLLFPRSPLDHFAAAFSNAGFMGIPLVRATFGEEAVFFLVSNVAMLNLLQFTYGASLLRKERTKMPLKEMLLNPVLLSIPVGLLLFVTGLGTRMPGVLRNAVSGLAGLNGPIAMMVLGVYLAQTDFKTTFTSPRLYRLCAVRLVLIPLLTLLLLLIPGDTAVKLVVLTAAAAPVGSNVAVYAQLYDADYSYACQTVALSTALSVLTLPCVLALAQMVLG